MWINGRYIIKAHRVTPIKHGFTNHNAHGFRLGALQVACFRCIQAVREWVCLYWRPKHIYNALIYFHETAVLKNNSGMEANIASNKKRFQYTRTGRMCAALLRSGSRSSASLKPYAM